MSQPNIVVVGSANIDLVTRCARVPQPGESIIGTDFATVTGGKGANQALAAARLGAVTRFAGCVGDDAFGAMQRETLAEAGVNLDALKTHPTAPTGTAVIIVTEDGQNVIIITPAANSGITPEDVPALEPVIAAADAVLLQLEIPLDTVQAVLELARRRKVVSVLDVGVARPLAPALLDAAHVVSPNETEAQAITGIPVHDLDSARRAALRLLDLGAEHAVLKLGARGALYAGRDEEFHVPAFTVDPVDTTAAGDAFTAALAMTWTRLGRAEAMRFANAAGALAATVHGAQPSMPRRDAVEQFLLKHANEGFPA